MDNKILYKLLHFLLHEMNDNIEFFHNKYSTEFNQSFEEFNTKGETIKQYNIYRKYETMIEHDLEEFCKQEKYDSIEDLYRDIKNLVERDNVKDIKEYNENISDDNLLVSLFEPRANDVLDTILHISSYTTFSTIMRQKNLSENISNDDSSNDEEDNSSYDKDDFDDSSDVSNDDSSNDDSSNDEEDNSSYEDDLSEESSNNIEYEDPILCNESKDYNIENNKKNDLPDLGNRLKINNFID